MHHSDPNPANEIVFPQARSNGSASQLKNQNYLRVNITTKTRSQKYIPHQQVDNFSAEKPFR